MSKLTEEYCDHHFSQLSIDTKRHIIAMAMELQKAEEKHPEWPIGTFYVDGLEIPKGDYIHAAAIVCEESGELIRAAIQFVYEGGQYYSMHKEAIQIGAMCLRFLNNAKDMPS